MLRKNGFPIPYYKFDVMDAMTAAPARADYPTFLEQTGARDPFDVLTSLMSIEAATASGFLPDPETDAPTILQQMCVRCHSGTEPSQLRRARFNARKLDELTPEGKADLIRRIKAPRDSHDVMPPRRGGELPDWAIARVVDYLSDR